MILDVMETSTSIWMSWRQLHDFGCHGECYMILDVMETAT